MRRLSLALTASWLTVAGSAFASGGAWPTYGHDFQRTARADGPGQIVSPSVAWTKSLGGTLTSQGSIIADLDGDGRPEILSISGGRVVALHSDGSSYWSGELVGAQGLLGVWSLDGASASEVVVYTPAGVEILAGATGSVLTTLSVPGAPSATFVPEAPQGGILVLSVSRGTASAYDFRSGITAAPSPLWTAYGANPNQYVAGDIDGDGLPELVRGGEDSFDALDPLTGAEKYGPLTLGPDAYFYPFQLANLDGNPGNEIIAIDTSYYYSPSAGIYVLGVQNGALTTLWSSAVSATVALSVDFFTVAGAAQDLDGDGTVEIVYSQWDATAGLWTTNIVDGMTGTNLGAISGQIVQAVADIDGDGKVEIVTRSNPLANQTPTWTTLTAYDFDSVATGPVAKPWNLPLAHVFTRANAQSVGPYAYLGVPIAANFDPSVPGLELLVGQDPNDVGQDTVVLTLDGANGAISNSAPVVQGLTVTARWVGNGLTSPTSTNDVVTFTNDGSLVERTSALVASGSPCSTGSYANWVYATQLSGANAAVFASTSYNDLLWLDGTHLHANTAPYTITDNAGTVSTTAWAAAGYGADPIVTLSGSSQTMVAFQQGTTAITLIGMDTSGAEFWQTELGDGTIILEPGAYVSDFTGDGNDDLLLPLQNINSLESLAIFDGTTGQLVSSTPLASIVSGSDQLAHGSLVDVNGDGVLDLVGPVQSIGVVAIDVQAEPMTSLWVHSHSQDSVVMDMGTIAVGPLSGSGGNDLARSGGNDGFGPHARLALDGTLGPETADDFPTPGSVDVNYEAFVTRAPGVYDVVSIGNSGLGLSRIQRVAGDTMNVVWTSYVSAGAITGVAPSQLYALHDPLEIDVDGNGTEEVVFGSDDGYLYALEAADGSLLWSFNLSAPVAHVIAANVDQDPALEIVASLGDGRLVAIDQVGAYAAVRDSSSWSGQVLSNFVSVQSSPGSVTPGSPSPGAPGVPSTPAAIGSATNAAGCATTPHSNTQNPAVPLGLMLAASVLARRRRRSA